MWEEGRIFEKQAVLEKKRKRKGSLFIVQ